MDKNEFLEKLKRVSDCKRKRRKPIADLKGDKGEPGDPDDISAEEALAIILGVRSDETIRSNLSAFHHGAGGNVFNPAVYPDNWEKVSP